MICLFELSSSYDTNLSVGTTQTVTGEQVQETYQHACAIMKENKLQEAERFSRALKINIIWRVRPCYFWQRQKNIIH